MDLHTQLIWLFTLPLPIACVAWTVTHEEIFHEPHEYCLQRSKDSRWLLTRKFFYLFTCEYCFSHYVTLGALFLTRFHLLLPDWRGYILAGFALVWIANIYMSLYAMIRIDLKKERILIKKEESEMEA
jgi:hypothetical protein